MGQILILCVVFLALRSDSVAQGVSVYLGQGDFSVPKASSHCGSDSFSSECIISHYDSGGFSTERASTHLGQGDFSVPKASSHCGSDSFSSECIISHYDSGGFSTERASTHLGQGDFSVPKASSHCGSDSFSSEGALSHYDSGGFSTERASAHLVQGDFLYDGPLRDSTVEVLRSSAATYLFHVVDISSVTPRVRASHLIAKSDIRLLSAVRKSTLMNDVIVVYSSDDDLFMMTLKSDGVVDPPSHVVRLPDVQSGFLYSHTAGILCFIQGQQLFFDTSNSQTNTWASPSPMSEMLNGKITSVIEDRKGDITAYCDGDRITKRGNYDSPQSWMNYHGGVIYSMRSMDGGSSWSLPSIAFKHNVLDLHNAMIVSVPGHICEQKLAFMRAKSSNKVLYSINRDGGGWSYPRFLADSFDAEVLGLYVTGRRVNIIYRHLASIYHWNGTLESLERDGLYHGAKLIMNYYPDSERIISVVYAGSNLLYLFAAHL